MAAMEMKSQITIRVQECQATNIAAWLLNKAGRNELAVVSDPCVVKALLALAQERGVQIQFRRVGSKENLDLAGVKRVLEGKDLEEIAGDGADE